MNQLKKLFEANFKSTFREKQVWFWSIFYPVLLLVIFLTIFGGNNDKDTNFKAKIAVVMEMESSSTIFQTTELSFSICIPAIGRIVSLQVVM